MSQRLTRMPIHVRRVVERDSGVASENEIYCLARASCVAVSECEACRDYVGTDLDLVHHRSYLLCRRMTPERARALVPARPALLRRRSVAQPTAADRTPVSEIMTAEVWCVREDVELAGLSQLFAKNPSGAVPVIDHQGRCVGALCHTDLGGIDAGSQLVSDRMCRLTFSLPLDASIAEAAALMALEGLHRLPIVAVDGRVAGMLTSMDVLAWLARQDGYVLAPDRRG
jgi:CBS-domain-containing membrane protein